jgi:small-conductance mechanosensitive channel
VKQNWMSLRRIEAITSIVQLEPLLILVALIAGAWVIYKLFLRQLIPVRHRSLTAHFKNTVGHLIATGVVFAFYYLLFEARNSDMGVELIPYVLPYVGIIAICMAAVVFVKICRILAFEYLFAVNMRVGVPVLIVNILSLALSLVLGFWILSAVFSINLAPVLATSAIFSLVLGLALQDTLGNLCAGVALAFDKPYEIGDWIEIQSDYGKWTGCVREISWRATLLVSFTDELITIPNRMMAQSEISNYSGKHQPVIRGHYLKVAYGTPLSMLKQTLSEVAAPISGIRKIPSPNVLVLDAEESWVKVKLIYWVDDFGAQFVIGDKVLSGVLEKLQKEGIELAPPRLKLMKES